LQSWGTILGKHRSKGYRDPSASGKSKEDSAEMDQVQSSGAGYARRAQFINRRGIFFDFYLP